MWLAGSNELKSVKFPSFEEGSLAGFKLSRSSKEFIRGLQDNAAEANRIVPLLGKKFPHGASGRA